MYELWWRVGRLERKVPYLSRMEYTARVFCQSEQYPKEQAKAIVWIRWR
jgi:hypothetical protein